MVALRSAIVESTNGCDILAAFFSDVKTNLKIAFKSVKFNLAQYASFFAALFLIQCFFGMLTVSSDMNRKITDDIVYAEYDYDVVFLDMNYSQMVFLHNDEIRIYGSDHIYNIVRIVDRYQAADNTTTYDVYMDFLPEDMDYAMKLFTKKYIPYLQEDLKPGQSIKYNYSEIYKLNGYKISSLISYVAFAGIMTAVSILLITSIYRIRVNHYKFTYGIYMSFGADFQQLCKTSFWEMMVVSLITFIPAQLFSTLVIFLIYHADGFAFSYDPLALLKIFIINLIIVAVSVCFPMWRVSRSLPTKLITSEDNSNLVTSPRRSFDFFKLTFPKKYELVSMWRFRKYLAIMIVTAVGFSSIFVAGFYVADFYKYTVDFAEPQLTAELVTDDVYDDTLIPDLAAIDGVYRVSASTSIDAPSVRSHTLIPSSSALPSASSIMATPENPSDASLSNYRATNDVNYLLADPSYIETITSDLFTYKIKGDPSKLFTQDNAVIVSNFIGNEKMCNYKLGDVIKVGAYAGRTKEIDYNLEGINRLRQELQYYKMDYVELEVVAIIDGIDTLGGSPIMLSKDNYRLITGDEGAEISAVDIYVAPDASLDDTKALFDNVRAYTSLYNGKLLLTDHHTVSNGIITRSLNYHPLIIAIAFLVLAISPLIWFFSQTLFVKKREKEFSVLLWLGTIKDDIRRLSKQNGLILAIISAVSCFLLSWGIITLIQLAVTRIPPVLYGGSQSYYFSVYIPIPALIVSTLISVACGYISSILPLGSFFKRFAATENSREFGASDDQ
ncbi:MAG: ABC transporter permease [Ruminococcaceae bacterium]|nr:ABC transporter permease [Oscillospiraceae bacterium]